MMKKIVLTLLLLIPLILRIGFVSENPLLDEVESKEVSKKEKNKNWEYVKENVFRNAIDRENSVPEKLSGSILFKLNNATAKDSLAVYHVVKK